MPVAPSFSGTKDVSRTLFGDKDTHVQIIHPIMQRRRPGTDPVTGAISRLVQSYTKGRQSVNEGDGKARSYCAERLRASV